MARLAAYYQEDFRYPVAQARQSAYGFYEDRTHLSNRKRIRSLGTSEPALSPKFVPADAYGSRHLDPSWRHSRYDANVFDSDSVSSFGDVLPHESRRSRPRHRRTRLSYAEPNSSQHPDLNNGIWHPEYYSPELVPPPRSFYRPESRLGQFLSPPSPFDSGLSSQSITSSPSLEAEPVSFHPRCRCPRVAYHPHGYDSGRMSPHSVPQNDRGCGGAEFDSDEHHFNPIRYGKLGIVGEPSNSEQTPRRRVENVPRPCVIIIESPEKSESSGGSSGRPAPDSPMSVTASESSSNNELDSDERRKSGKSAESEIRELEDMYARCNLNDRDLLDRAERRDLPTPHQERAGHRLTRSNSDTLYEVFRNPYETPARAPPLRRSGLPDRIADDMALRKLQKPAPRSGSSPADNTITYMLCSAHFTPAVPAGRDVLFHDCPDVERDDFSYRKHYLGRKSRIADPQPPFGIPLRPPPPRQVCTDYLHLLPSDVPQPLCHARRNPDVVRDDLAFRTLRKDEPDRLYYDMSQFYKKTKR